MTRQLRRDGASARKFLGSRPSTLGRRLARRSKLLAAAGVHTPIGVYDEQSNELVFPWIKGRSGRELLRHERTGATDTGWDAVSDQLFAAFLKPLSKLHSTDPNGIGLASLDPWRKVYPRLRDRINGRPNIELILDIAWSTYLYLKDFLEDVHSTDALSAQPLIHGDFHVGQILFEPHADSAWLLDTDDAALGPAEYDLGNFIAHIVTSEDLYVGDIAVGFAQLQRRVCALYAELSGHSSDRTLVTLYGTSALLRRALKLLERGACPTFSETIVFKAKTIAFGLL